MGIFERYLSIWVALCMIAGILLGVVFPQPFATIANIEIAQVNLIVAVLIWVMIYPMMLQIDFSAIKDIGKKPQGLVLTVVLNWIVKPFTMALLGWLFFRIFFAGWVHQEDATEYIAGMILLGVAPCTAMVFVWSQLTNGDANYTLVQVSVNDVILIFAFAPITALLLGVSDISVPWMTLLVSVIVYVVIPLVAGILTRHWLNTSHKRLPNMSIEGLLNQLKPWSIIGLLSTVILLFGFQAETILAKPQHILLIAIPLVIQTYGIFFIAYYLSNKLRLAHNIAAPACMIATSNFFELAVAVAISLFGLNSGAALATVVGVLVEVPVMLSLVAFMNSRKQQYCLATQ